MLLVVGRIGRAHGIRGEATIEVRSNDPETRFAIGAQLITDPPEKGPLTITFSRVHNGTLLLTFAGVHDRNDVEKLRNVSLMAEVDINAPGENSDDFHLLQLLGCEVFLADGAKVGTITDVLNLPGQDTLAVETGNGEVLIPFVRKIVPEVDILNKKIIITPPDGLLDQGLR